MRKLKNRNIFLLLTIILSLGITLGAVYFMYQYRDSRENSLSTGLISLKFTDQSNTVNLSSNVPMIDDLGLKNTPYEFTIENTSKVPINVDIKVDVDNNTSIHLGAVRYGIYIDDKLVKKDYIHNDLILYTYEELLRDESINCKIKFWVDYYYDRPNQTFIGKIKAEGSSRDKLYNGVTVTFDKGNLVYGLEDTDWINISSDRKYKIENEVVTLHSDRDDGFMDTIGRVYLEAGKTYIFNCDTDGIWGQFSGTDTVQSYLVLDDISNYHYYHMNDTEMNNNGYYEFTPTVTGIYRLRFDVNKAGEEHTFSNISIVEKDTSKETKEVGIGEIYGKLPTPTRDGYTFMGWNGKNLFSLTQNSAVTNRITQNTTVNITNESVEISCSDDVAWRCFGKYFELKTGTYTIRFKTTSSDNNFTPIATIYDRNNTNIVNRIMPDSSRTFTLQSDTLLELRMFCTEASNAAPRTVKFYDIQIEEGIEATEYEPYYITSKTKVVQKGNHTLKAIWKKNS